MDDQRIQVAVCVDRLDGDYFKFGCVTLLSASRNSSVPIDFHILSFDVESDAVGQMRDIIRRDGSNIMVHTIDKNSLGLDGWMCPFGGTFLRLIIPDVLRTSRVIYLDVDILVNTDLLELWQYDLDEMCIGAVPDSNADAIYPLRVRTSMFDNPVYFNAGVILMDLDSVRERHDMLKESLDALRANKSFKMKDQDAINYVFSGEIMSLPAIFNTFASNVGDDTSGRVIHYAGSKPWSSCNGRCYREYWEHMFALPWMADPKIATSLSIGVFDHSDVAGRIVKDMDVKSIAKLLLSVALNKLRNLRSPATRPEIDRKD